MNLSSHSVQEIRLPWRSFLQLKFPCKWQQTKLKNTFTLKQHICSLRNANTGIFPTCPGSINQKWYHNDLGNARWKVTRKEFERSSISDRGTRRMVHSTYSIVHIQMSFKGIIRQRKWTHSPPRERDNKLSGSMGGLTSWPSLLCNKSRIYLMYSLQDKQTECVWMFTYSFCHFFPHFSIVISFINFCLIYFVLML